jgi:hypothetical protein
MTITPAKISARCTTNRLQMRVAGRPVPRVPADRVRLDVRADRSLAPIRPWLVFVPKPAWVGRNWAEGADGP